MADTQKPTSGFSLPAPVTESGGSSSTVPVTVIVPPGETLSGTYTVVSETPPRDMLIGGAGADRFVFKSVVEAGKGNAGDDIRDFSRAQGDKIDLSGIDAMTNKAGDQAFSFIGSKGFSGDAGELRYAKGHLYGDVNGDKIADFDIHLVNSHALNGTHFIL